MNRTSDWSDSLSLTVGEPCSVARSPHRTNDAPEGTRQDKRHVNYRILLAPLRRPSAAFSPSSKTGGGPGVGQAKKVRHARERDGAVGGMLVTLIGQIIDPDRIHHGKIIHGIPQ